MLHIWARYFGKNRVDEGTDENFDLSLLLIFQHGRLLEAFHAVCLASMSGAVLGGVVEAVGSNLARGVFFFCEGREDRNSTKSGSPSVRQRNAIGVSLAG